jgi:carboxyl-terminal processing protease
MFGGNYLRMTPVRCVLTVAVWAVVGLAAPVDAQERLSSTRGGWPYGGCSTLGQNLRTRDILDDLYLWRQYLPDVDPVRFPSPEAYLEAVRYRPLDTSYSYITPKAAHDALFSDSQYIGFGFSTRATNTEITILQVFPGSPASEAQLARGDRIVAVDGRTIGELTVSGAIDTVFGDAAGGVSVSVDVVTRAGQSRRVTLEKRMVTIPPVSLTRVYQVNGRIVGYVFFRQFVRPSMAALDEAFAALRQAGATELVLDLRYNGGGLLDVAVRLASLIGDVTLRGQVFATLQHNDRNRDLDETYRFEAVANPLRLSRLVVITTRSSASASELLINGLRPYLPVTVVGDRTFGKPVGQYSIDLCNRVVLPVAFITLNARGEADYFDGIAADCIAADDAGHELGAVEEASLAEALTVIRTGNCNPANAGARSLRRMPLRAPVRSALPNAQ